MRARCPPELALDVLEAARANPDPALSGPGRGAGGAGRRGRSFRPDCCSRRAATRCAGSACFGLPSPGSACGVSDAGGLVFRRVRSSTGIGGPGQPGVFAGGAAGSERPACGRIRHGEVTRKDGEVIEGLRLKETSEELTASRGWGHPGRACFTDPGAQCVHAVRDAADDGVLTPREIRDGSHFSRSGVEGALAPQALGVRQPSGALERGRDLGGKRGFLDARPGGM